jgi:Uncharacterized conserved protein
VKVLIARMNHETNTFSPVPTPLESFGPAGPTYGPDAYEANFGKRTAMAAFIDLARQHDAQIVTPIDATAYPSGRVQADAYEHIVTTIVSQAPGCDALLLDLHGAMVAEQTDDGEGDLLERLRQTVPGVPIAVALDLHGNVTQKMIDNADVIVSFKTYPHIDMYETGELAGRLLFAKLKGEIEPVMAWRRLPLITHTLRSGTQSEAMLRAVEAAKQAEAEGMGAVSVLPGFGLADIQHPCISVVVVGKGDRNAAQAVADRIAGQIWDEREGFTYEREPMSASLDRAKSLAAKANQPVLLLDHGDNCMSGGTCDTMDVLSAALQAGMEGILAGLYCDPEAVGRMHEAGVGSRLTLPVGNKRSLEHLGRKAAPLMLEGVVIALSDGWYTITGPTYTGQRACMGRSAVLDIGAARLVVTERTHEPWDLGVFESLGQDPRQARFLILKSRMYCRPVFVPISAGLVECDSPGATSADWSMYPYRRRARPLYPLEDQGSEIGAYAS